MIEYKGINLSVDKSIDKNTTSHQFKKDLIDEFKDSEWNNTILEVSCNRGYTTSVLSKIFGRVYAVEVEDRHLRKAKSYNKFRTNIQNRFDLLISEIEAERNQCEKIQDNIRTIKNDYVKYFWKYPHEIVMEELTEKQREQCDIFNYETTNKFKEIVLDRINKIKPDEIKVND